MLNFFKKNLFIISITYTLFVYVICLVKVSDSVKLSVNNADKFIHFGIYFSFTLLWFFVFYGFNFKNNLNKAIIKSSLFAFFNGIFIELLQEIFTKSRSADLNDIFANTFGILFSVLCIVYFKKIYTVKNQ